MKTKPGLFSRLWTLGMDKRASSPRLLMRLLRDEEGSYLVYMTLAMPILIGVAALGTEAGLAFYNHRTLQSAADSAAYSAAISYSYNTSADITTQAKAIVASYGFTLGTGNNRANVPTPTIITNYAGSKNTAIKVSLSRPQSTIFSGFYGFSALSNSVSATAVIAGSGSGGNGGGNCIFALGNTATGNNAADAIQLQGNPTISAPGCGIFSNSTDCTSGSYSESFGGNASITAGSMGSAGCMTIFGNAQVHLPGGVTCNSSSSTACTQNDGAISNPFAKTTLPTTSSPGSCTATTTVGSNGTVAGGGKLCPGVYTHGLEVDLPGNSNNTVTLQPGIYILNCSASTCPSIPGGGNAMLYVKNGTLTDSLDSNGNGVTLVFNCETCSSASQWPSNGMLVAANGTLTLTAGANGFLMMGDTNMALNMVFDTHSNPHECLNGTVYLPNANFEWGGTPVTGCQTKCLQLIANMISLSGNPSFSGNGCSVDQSAGTGGAQVPIGSVVTLVD
jgi:Flp pilus assembly protein TadG